MKRLLQVLGIGIGLVALLALMVNLMAEPPSGLPAVDPDLAITLPGGEQQPLRDLLARHAADPPAEGPGDGSEAGSPPGRVPEEDAPPETASADGPSPPAPEPGATAPHEGPRGPSGIVDEHGRILVAFDGPMTADEILGHVMRALEIRWETETPDVFDLATYAQYHGRLDQASALYRSVPEGHPRFGEAQRILGWELYTEAWGEPGRGVAFVNRAVAADPFDAQAWQDLSRVYARGLGLPVD